MALLGSISVDLDGLDHYCYIQGLSTDLLNDRARTLVATTAIPRLCELFQELQLPATFFVIGSSVATPFMAKALRQAAAQQIELANHSFSHSYRLSRWTLPEILSDLAKAQAAIAGVTGVAPTGFRAPGYTMSKALAQAVETLSFDYASSTFPAVPYYLAKAVAMASLRMLGRPSRAVLDTPHVLTAPRKPYHPSLENPYRPGAARYIELPISVTPVFRLPVIGTFVSMLPERVVSAAVAALSQEAFFNFEWHALDVLDVTDGIPQKLARQQRDLLIPARLKIARLKKILQSQREREWIPLRIAAGRLSSRL
jgi:peptidoglycan-N-acetylglucosamine deacetylase